MESSEEDAGAATDASRRATARESERPSTSSGDACSSPQRPADGGGGSSAMSDDNFDGDSVPSPSPSGHELNTSTEAILDMIDEIVDGPGAPRRLPREPSPPDPPPTTPPQQTDNLSQQHANIEVDTVSLSANSEILLVSESNQPNLQLECELSTGSCESPQSTSVPQPIVGSMPESQVETVSTETEAKMEPESSMPEPETEASVSDTLVEPASSEPETQMEPVSSTPEPETEAVSTLPETSVEVITPVPESQIEPASSISGPEVEPVSSISGPEVEPPFSISGPDVEPASSISSPEVEPASSRSEPADEAVSSIPETHEPASSVPELNVGEAPEPESASEMPLSVQEQPVQEPSLPPAVDTRSISPVVVQEAMPASTQEPIMENPHVNLPSSSNSGARDTSECQVHERTIKCVTSSEHKGNVTVESAESTSSDTTLNAPVTRSPLRRRLVRPARPDTTVSSTVDLQTYFTQTLEPSTSESVTKDVSSSSDAVTSLRPHDCQASNVSEVSVCKAETSLSPPKKIKLIRNRVTPPVSHSIQVKEQPQPEQCQSTSTLHETSCPVSRPEPVESRSSVNCISTSETSEQNENLPQDLDSNDSFLKAEDDSRTDDNKETPVQSPLQQPSNSSSNFSLSKEAVDDNTLEAKVEQRKVPPIKLNLASACSSEQSQETESDSQSSSKQNRGSDETIETFKQVPKLTIKLGNKPQTEEMSSPVVPKLTIKPIRPPPEDTKPALENEEQIPSVPKISIKPIPRPPVKINDVHRKSSSSEISESESSENDDSNSVSDQASASDQGPVDVIPKVTIKMGKPGTQSEGKFYTEKNFPKLTIKTTQNEEHEDESVKFKLRKNLNEDKQHEKIPKLTIKPVIQPDNQPLSPRLKIKPIRPPEDISLTVENCEIPKLKITQGALSPRDIKENAHIPKITIKPVTKPEPDTTKTLKKSANKQDDYEQIPVVTKLNIKPIPKPTDSTGESSDSLDDKVPVVSKLNIKPIVKPKDNELQSNIEDIPKVTKLNIKPIKKPEENVSEAKDCDEWKTGSDETSIPVITKLNIKPIVKPVDEDEAKDSENLSSETGNSSDENSDQIPVVTKLNIKPIVRPNENENAVHLKNSDETIPVVTKLNIKPLVKPDDNVAPSSPKREKAKGSDHKNTDHVPVVTKINIKPIVKPENVEKTEESVKNPPLLMKINIKSMIDGSTSDSIADRKCEDTQEHATNNIDEIPVVPKIHIKPIIRPSGNEPCTRSKSNESSKDKNAVNCITSSDTAPKQNCVSALSEDHSSHAANTKDCNITRSLERNCKRSDSPLLLDKLNTKRRSNTPDTTVTGYSKQSMKRQALEKLSQLSQESSSKSCTLLKKLLEDNTKKIDENSTVSTIDEKSNVPLASMNAKPVMNCELNVAVPLNTNSIHNKQSDSPTRNQVSTSINELLTRPLEINTVLEKDTNSGQDSPRIILKINKTDQGSSSEIITEDIRTSPSIVTSPVMNDKLQKNLTNSRKKNTSVTSEVVGKRLRSSRIVQEAEKSPAPKKYMGKRTPEEPEMSDLEAKRAKLGQLLMNKSLTITPVESKQTVAPSSQPADDDLAEIKSVNARNHILNNQNCSKNGNSKLHKILSNLTARRMQATPNNDVNRMANSKSLLPELDSTNTSTGSSDVVEIVENSQPEVQLVISDSSRDYSAANEDAQDPLEASQDTSKVPEEVPSPVVPVPVVMMTPQPKKRGRPRKVPLSEGAVKPVPLPVPALEERPQRSLRLSRDRPAVTPKPRGRGRGRTKRISEPAPAPPPPKPVVESANRFFDKSEEEIDPTSSRIKLPRMTEALDKSSCSTPLTSRRRSSLDPRSPECKVVLAAIPAEAMPSPGAGAGRARGRGGRGRAPRRSGRGRGGGRGATYMKETMGIYGRVCGPATTTVQLFEEETCMMDDNATPAKPSHLLDEDSQSSVKSSTNESSKMKKSKFADLFDCNKVWTAADVKEYMWPPETEPGSEHHVTMIQEQVAMFLGVKSFRRRYPELQRRAVAGAERDHLLSRGLVQPAVADLGITAVDASEVLDIMLSDYPHKYEEYRGHQRARQLAEASAPPPAPAEGQGLREVKIDFKQEAKPEPAKVDPVKLRQDMAAAAAASAAEFNVRLNALRRPACVDLQSMTVHRRRAPPPPPREHVTPPAGAYPHALLPGQYQHWCRAYTPDQLRYFPLNTALGAPPPPSSPPDSGSDSEPDWSSDHSADQSDTQHSHKRRKLTKTRASSEGPGGGVEPEAPLCRACGLREEANRKYSHERFLHCAHCNAHLHPSCLELGPDTIRKCREYAWQCAECKSCCGCQRPQDDDKMLFCDLCDRGFHIYCVGLGKVPSGRWHCVECAVCKSCGARDAAGPAPAPAPSPAPAPAPAPPAPAEWHHQSKRGPGGHKVYSHSLCSPCARAYRIGRYCPLCDRSFIGPKGTMQLVICKLCDRQLHQECVKATVSSLNVMDYTCGECRRGGITSRSAAVRLAPRTIATLFMAKRRFNKYAHRQYMQSRKLKGKASDDGVDAPEVSEDGVDAPDDSVTICVPDESLDADADADEASDPLDTETETESAVKALHMDYDD